MADLKERRQRAIADLIRTHPVASQEELAERLGSLGFAVTQATISRDLDQIGALKVWRGDQLILTTPLKAEESVAKGTLSQRAFDAVTEMVIALFRAGAERL